MVLSIWLFPVCVAHVASHDEELSDGTTNTQKTGRRESRTDKEIERGIRASVLSANTQTIDSDGQEENGGEKSKIPDEPSHKNAPQWLVFAAGLASNPGPVASVESALRKYSLACLGVSTRKAGF